MIDSIELKSGRGPGLPNEIIQTTPVTVFVGPNNSGKSKVLAEINKFCRFGKSDPSDVIIERIVLSSVAESTIENRISEVRAKPNQGDAEQPGHMFIEKRGKRHHIPIDQFRRALKDPNSHTKHYCPWYLGLNTIILDGKNRIQLAGQQAGGDLKNPQLSFSVLFRDDKKRAEVRRIV